MEVRVESPSLDALLSQSRWVESVALGILGDRSAAADVAQEARIQAWRRPPGEVAPRPWMSAVGRRLALSHLRREARLGSRERQAARDEALPSTGELVAQAETRRFVAEEVVELDEPYRTIVLLRYFKDLSSAEIARRQDLPAATVRSQLKRGLELLRVRLEQRMGGPDRCRQSLAGVAAAPPFMSSPWNVWKGALAMKGLTQLGAIAVLLASIAGVWWSFGRSDAAEIEPTHITAEATRELAAQQPSIRATPPAVVDERASVAQLEPTAEPDQEVAASADIDLPATLDALFVDAEGGAPIEGVVVAATGKSGGATSGPDGHVEVEFDLVRENESVELKFEAFGRATRFQFVFLERGETAHLGRVSLELATRVAGLVVDSFGRPMSDVRVLVTGLDAVRDDADEQRRHGPSLGGSAVESTTDGEGRFELIGVPPGFVRLWAWADGYAWATAGPIETGPGGETDEVTLQLEELVASDRILARVLSPEGDPVPNAQVGISYRSGSLAAATTRYADEDGHFDLLVDHRVPHALRIEDPEDRWTQIHADHVEPSSVPHEFQFAQTTSIDLFVHDSKRRPIESFLVATRRPQEPVPGVTHGPIQEIECEAEDAGRLRVRVADASFTIIVDADGYAAEELGPFEPGEAPTTLEVELQALPGLTGRVLFEGQPVEGAEVELLSRIGLENVYQVNGFRTLVLPYALGQARTDHEGRFRLPLRGRGEFCLRARHGERLSGVLGPIQLDEQEGADGLEITVEADGRLTGNVLSPDGRGVEGAVIAINQGFGKAFTLRSGSEGHYEVELPPGPVQVELHDEEVQPFARSSNASTHDEPVEMDWSTEIRSGQTTRFDLESDSVAVGRVLGHLIVTEASGWTAELVREPIGGAPVLVASAALGSEGRFELEFARPGPHALILRAPFSSNRLVLREVLEVEPGDQGWELDLPCGSVELESGSRMDHGLRYHFVDSSNRFPERSLTATIDVSWVEGLIRLPLVPAGLGDIERFEPTENGGGRWDWRVSLDVQRNATTREALPR